MRSFECDHKGKYNNKNFHKLFSTNGTQFCFSCLYTSQQNRKSKRMFRTFNNMVHTFFILLSCTFLIHIRWNNFIWRHVSLLSYHQFASKMKPLIFSYFKNTQYTTIFKLFDVFSFVVSLPLKN